MARYADVPDGIKIQSEMIEPAFQSIYGRLFAQAEYMKTTYGKNTLEYVDALENLWWAAKSICELTGLCIDTHHASVAASNHMGHVARHIEKELGFDPLSFSDNFTFRTMMPVIERRE